MNNINPVEPERKIIISRHRIEEKILLQRMIRKAKKERLIYKASLIY